MRPDPHPARHAAARLGEGAIAVQNPPLGTGHAVLSAKAALADFDGDVVVTYADGLLEAEVMEPLFALRGEGADVAVLGFEAAHPGGYGRLILKDADHLARIVEAKDASDVERAVRLCNSGVLAAPRALLFELLEDDLCRTDAMTELRKVPEAAQPYAVLLLRGCTETLIQGSIAARRRRSTLQLLSEFGICERDWPEIRKYLHDEDLDCVIATAHIGLTHAPESATETIVETLVEASARMNWAREMDVTELLDGHRAVAGLVAKTLAVRHADEGERPNWLSPFWRILYHVLGDHLEQEP